jgi:hypothetical protein
MGTGSVVCHWRRLWDREGGCKNARPLLPRHSSALRPPRHGLKEETAMTLDDLTNAQFAVLTLLSLGCLLGVGAMIRLAIEKRQE